MLKCAECGKSIRQRGIDYDFDIRPYCFVCLCPKDQKKRIKIAEKIKKRIRFHLPIFLEDVRGCISDMEDLIEEMIDGPITANMAEKFLEDSKALKKHLKKTLNEEHYFNQLIKEIDKRTGYKPEVCKKYKSKIIGLLTNDIDFIKEVLNQLKDVE